jgi:predicted nucleic acid-binding protein
MRNEVASDAPPLYAESSAVLSWLLGEGEGPAVRKQLASSALVLASDLTLIECDRVLIRAVSARQMNEAQAADRRRRLAQAAGHWTIFGLEQEIVDRARRPFPREPLRTLDAIHLATAIIARSVVPEVRLLSLDQRARASGRELGFDVVPPEPIPSRGSR